MRPPADAATSYEDLPEDLFGEADWQPGPAPAAAGPPRRDGGPMNHPTNGPTNEPTTGPTTVQDDPVLDAVGRLFPGRIVGVEPHSDGDGEDPGPAGPEATDHDPESADGDGPARPVADGGRGTSG